ncbi:MAG: type I methionyl aminopeptidase [Candidatus Pacebacteria bacterium]|nr:type I methionyl aminopeptidase [Candidatus Paceibacterota bacterium]MBP9840183.1 type I methionyl aminopeptidase [Candidatus Paceibacterota bacterium]
MTIRTPEEREALLEAGKRLGVILEELQNCIAPGVTTMELEEVADRMIREGGDTTAFKGYTPEGAARPYPASLCVSINEDVVHGIPNEGPRTLAEGDIITLDLGLTHKGIIVDSAITVGVGAISNTDRELIGATEAALEAGIAAAKVGGKVGDISNAIEQSYKGTKFAIVKVLGGHGVGNRVHEEPFVSNFGHPGTGEELVDGMVLALEPIATSGKGGVLLASDGYTYRTKDGSRAAHSEHTILIENNGTTVVTRRPSEKS